MSDRKPTWIMLIKKLPTNPSPPKMSIHWATPWPFEGYMTEIEKRQLLFFSNQDYEDEILDPEKDFWFDGQGYRPNEARAWAIQYKDATFKVWNHECSIMTPAKMHTYIIGDIGDGDWSHTLVEGTESDAALLRAAMDTDLRGLFDAALLDGANPTLAKLIAMGVEFEDDELIFPPIGWYRIHPAYADFYCTESEMTE